ncbi:unnamed protein product [Protopolystoma xenopodis]|uniref:Uncharacterized protein n=1 Tax=Protopolystoma xenopodis TaxID=117903 RepID=A0A3S5B5T7_9PLAT|nr:unnamed protein product [Protopolystoma xenopodis]
MDLSDSPTTSPMGSRLDLSTPIPAAASVANFGHGHAVFGSTTHLFGPNLPLPLASTNGVVTQAASISRNGCTNNLNVPNLEFSTVVPPFSFISPICSTSATPVVATSASVAAKINEASELSDLRTSTSRHALISQPMTSAPAKPTPRWSTSSDGRDVLGLIWPSQLSPVWIDAARLAGLPKATSAHPLDPKSSLTEFWVQIEQQQQQQQQQQLLLQQPQYAFQFEQQLSSLQSPQPPNVKMTSRQKSRENSFFSDPDAQATGQSVQEVADSGGIKAYGANSPRKELSSSQEREMLDLTDVAGTWHSRYESNLGKQGNVFDEEDILTLSRASKTMMTAKKLTNGLGEISIPNQVIHIKLHLRHAATQPQGQ